MLPIKTLNTATSLAATWIKIKKGNLNRLGTSRHSLETRYNNLVKLNFTASAAKNKLTQKINNLLKVDATHVIRYIKK